jgi:hypothetical protein
LEKFVLLGAELLDDFREEILDGLGLGFATDDEGVVLNGCIGYVGKEVPSGFLKCKMVLSSLKKLISSTPRGCAPTFLTMVFTILSLPP